MIVQSRSEVSIVVVRSGGFAGLRKRWAVTPDTGETDPWLSLIDECPWDAPCSTGSSDAADRFSWTITARTAHRVHERDLAESELTGPWRELVEAVREFSRAAKETPPAARRSTPSSRSTRAPASQPMPADPPPATPREITAPTQTTDDR